MTRPTRPSADAPLDQRQALQDSEHKATETEPANFRDQATAEKIVEIPPVDAKNKPIRGLDPK